MVGVNSLASGISGHDLMTGAKLSTAEANAQIGIGVISIGTAAAGGGIGAGAAGRAVFGRGGFVRNFKANRLRSQRRFRDSQNRSNTGAPSASTSSLTNAELVQNIANRADRWGNRRGWTAGSTAGKKKHKYAETLLDRYQQRFGDRGLTTEVPYFDGRPNITNRGYVRLDVVDGPLENPYAIYDYKFGRKGLSNSRIAQIRRVGHFSDTLPIIEVRPR